MRSCAFLAVLAFLSASTALPTVEDQEPTALDSTEDRIMMLISQSTSETEGRDHSRFTAKPAKPELPRDHSKTRTAVPPASGPAPGDIGPQIHGQAPVPAPGGPPSAGSSVPTVPTATPTTIPTAALPPTGDPTNMPPPYGLGNLTMPFGLSMEAPSPESLIPGIGVCMKKAVADKAYQSCAVAANNNATEMCACAQKSKAICTSECCAMRTPMEATGCKLTCSTKCAAGQGCDMSELSKLNALRTPSCQKAVDTELHGAQANCVRNINSGLAMTDCTKFKAAMCACSKVPSAAVNSAACAGLKAGYEHFLGCSYMPGSAASAAALPATLILLAAANALTFVQH